MKNLLLIFISVLSFSCSAQEKKCSDFRTGTFEYTDPSMAAYTILRTDSLQVEKNRETGIEIHTSVNWKSDCEYELTYLKILNVDQDISHIIGQKINVKITTTDGETYEAAVKSDAVDSVVKFKKV